MTRVELAPEVADDLERIVAHVREHSGDAPARIREIVAAFSVLEHAPEIGRPAEAGLRELVSGRGSKTFVAHYRYVEQLDTVLILAIRSAREAGYAT